MGIMGSDLPSAEARAQRRQQKERKEQEWREQQDARARADILRSGRELPDNEFLGLGVVIRDGDVLAWSRTVVQVLGPLAGAQAGIAGPVRTRGAGTAVAATLAFGVVGGAAALGARGSKPFAYVVFPDGTLYQSELTDKRVAARAQADVLRFNVLATRGDQE